MKKRINEILCIEKKLTKKISMKSGKKALCFAVMIFASLCAVPLPSGYGSLKLGMSVDEVKTELKKDGSFGYRGDRDVSLSPSSNQVIIATDGEFSAYSFFRECFFLFVEEKLFSITLNLNEEKIDYNSVFTTLSKKYGNPDSISPRKATWEDEEILMSLEKPLTLKYIDAKVHQKNLESAEVEKNAAEQIRELFLEGL